MTLDLITHFFFIFSYYVGCLWDGEKGEEWDKLTSLPKHADQTRVSAVEVEDDSDVDEFRVAERLEIEKKLIRNLSGMTVFIRQL